MLICQVILPNAHVKCCVCMRRLVSTIKLSFSNFNRASSAPARSIIQCGTINRSEDNTLIEENTDSLHYRKNVTSTSANSRPSSTCSRPDFKKTVNTKIDSGSDFRLEYTSKLLNYRLVCKKCDKTCADNLKPFLAKVSPKDLKFQYGSFMNLI